MELEQGIFYVIVLIFSVVIHEVAHGYAADALGDRTARYAGRLTINPLPHLDIMGSVVIPLTLILSGAPFLVGWAKPVPFNLSNIKNKRWGPALIALAGPAANIVLAIIFALILRVQVPGLEAAGEIFAMIIVVNVALVFFNLLPVPPLDGHHVLFSILSGPEYSNLRNFMRRYQIFLILLVIFVVWPRISPALWWVVDLLV